MIREIQETLILKQLCPHKDHLLGEETKTRVEKQKQGQAD